MKPRALSIPAVFFTMLNLSCATLIRGNRDYFAIRDVPPGITLRINGAPAEPDTCYEFERNEDSTVELVKEGNVIDTIRVRRRFYPWALVPSMAMGGPVGLLVDLKGGGLYEMNEDQPIPNPLDGISSIRLEPGCGPEWNRYRVSVQGGITLRHRDSGRKTAATQFNQGWLTLGGRGFEHFELFTELFYLSFADVGDPEQEVDIAYTLPFPFVSAPTGLNLYFVSHPKVDVFLGSAFARASAGARAGDYPLTAHLGCRVRLKGNWEFASEIKSLSVDYFETEGLDSSRLADRWILLYGLGRSWR